MDTFSKAERSAVMARIRSANTEPEMIVRRLVHAMGHRYRLHRADLPGKPDLVFPKKRKVIFVHGCFWHQHGCKGSHQPKSNTAYWIPKLERNQRRDAEHLSNLRAMGWNCLILWDCELGKSSLSAKLSRFLG